MHLPRAEFERLVEEALTDIPQDFLDKLENIEILVEDYPGPEDFPRGLPRGSLLLGVYRGVPRTRRGSQWSPLYPDRIVIFQQNIERICNTREHIVAQVRRTVVHEIAHYFGISDARLRELGYG
jgi:predicted Zn-dependent protease with MMP-like domain